jgi:polyketide cyclase/dehydrase/lipid transport protein
MNINKLKSIIIIAVLSSVCVLSQTSVAAGSLAVTKEVSINAAPDTVWKMVGGFNELDMWHPVVVNSQLQGKGVKVGDIRILTLGNGAKITEKLVVHSDAKKTYTYAITESPLPVMDYVSTISVFEAEDGMSKVEWKSTFNANDAPDDKAVETIAGIYDAGLNNLVKHFNQ